MSIVMSDEEARKIQRELDQEFLTKLNLQITKAAKNGENYVEVYQHIYSKEWDYLKELGYNIIDLSDRDGILIRVRWR